MGTAAVSLPMWPTTAGAASGAGVEPFTIRVSDEDLDDLRSRLAMTRWPAEPPGEAWEYGTDRSYLKQLIDYWRNEYDWRKHEAELNAFNNYTTTIDGQLIHFVHQKGKGPNPLPLVMTHG